MPRRPVFSLLGVRNRNLKDLQIFLKPHVLRCVITYVSDKRQVTTTNLNAPDSRGPACYSKRSRLG